MSKGYSLILAAILATMTQQGVARQLGVSQRIDARVAAGGHNNLEVRAEHRAMLHDHAAKRQNFNQSSTRTLANGEVIQRNTTQTVTDNGFTRNSTMTNSEGQTATKNVTVVNDKEAGTHSRTMSGTTFDGKSYSGSSITQKTEDGFSRESTFTNPEGKTGSRSTVGVVDKEAGTMTKTTTTTKPNGETTQHSVTHQMSQQSKVN